MQFLLKKATCSRHRELRCLAVLGGPAENLDFCNPKYLQPTKIELVEDGIGLPGLFQPFP